MWIYLALISSLCIGMYDIFKKVSLRGNNVLLVLLLNTLFSTLLLSPVLARGGLGLDPRAHALMLLKAAIVLSSWISGYFAIKHLPLTVQGPINATRPVMVLVGAVCLLGERPGAMQWAGVALGFISLFLIAGLARRDGQGDASGRWVCLSIVSMLLGAASSLFDKLLLHACHFHPLDVQAWYTLYQCLLMAAIVAILSRRQTSSDPFSWRWTIPCISIFITLADIAYFHALSAEGAMVCIVSMTRRGSVIVSFLYGVVALKERNVRAKAFDLCILLASIILLVLGSLQDA